MSSLRDKFYKNYISSNEHKQANEKEPVFIHNKPYFKWLLKKANLSQQTKILDFGCGNGILLYFLKQNGYNELAGIDTSQEQIAYAHSVGITEAQLADGINYLRTNPNTYDAIFLLDVLEHFSKEEAFELTTLLYQKLNSNGKLIVHVPNGEGLFGMGIRYGDFTHENAYTKNSISQFMAIIGFNKTIVLEEEPIIYSISSFFRNLLWRFGTFLFRIVYLAETGSFGAILSKNILSISYKS